MCKCGKDTDARLQYLLRCNLYTFYEIELLSDIYMLLIHQSIKDCSEEKPLTILLYGSLDFNNDKSRKYFKQTVKYLKLQKDGDICHLIKEKISKRIDFEGRISNNNRNQAPHSLVTDQ